MELDYRSTLKNHFDERVKKNSQYSLRSYARDLGIAAPRLSEILNFKKGLSEKAGMEIASRLGINKFETEIFISSIMKQHSRSPSKRKLAEQKLREIGQFNKENQIELENYKLIADWYHFTILELLTLVDVNTKEDIARRLNLPTVTVENALLRLIDLGLLKKYKNFYIPIEENSFTGNDIPSQAIKMHHEQILDKASSALFEQDVEKREFGSTIIAFNSKNINDVKKLIRDFRQNLAKLIDADVHDEKDSVYVLGTQFFRLDKEIK